ncbi:MAG: YihY/virulence factor BrkB family protein [Actinomycetota bacterium]|nr:YihY/virulence factor BrkB family protein [Actinomycetota bacterium]
MASDSSTRRADYQPEGADPKPSTGSTLKRTVQEFSEDNLTDWAAALTYYGLLSLFPALIAMVSVMGLVGDPATVTKTITDVVTQLGPKSAADALSGPIKSITSNPTGAGIALIAGLAGALWSASGYVGAFMRASQIIWETPEGRPIWKLRPLQLLVTLVMIVLTAVVALSLVLTGPIVQAVAAPLGLGSTAVTIWDYAKWPVLVLIVLVITDVLYFAAPNVKQRGFGWLTKGALLALVVWLIASVAFAFFVANFGSYNKTYGSLAGLVVFLVWLWITNVAVLLGMEFNAERERSAELSEGVVGAEREIQGRPRAEPKEQRTT